MSAAPLLTILKDGEMVKSMPLEQDAILGRGEDCVIRLEDRAISRQHLIFKRNKEGVSVEKKSQFAPLKVNGAEVEQAQLGEGDVISIGPYLLRLSQLKANDALVASQAQPNVSPAQAGALSLVHTATYEPPTVTETASEKHEAATPSSDSLDSFSDSAPVDLTSFVEQPAKEPSKDEGEFVEHSLDAPLDFSSPAEPASQEPALQESAPEQEAFQQSEEVAPNEEAPSNLVDSSAFASDEDAKTKLTAVSHVRAVLVFRDGAANVTEYEINKNEVSIGRSKNCDIVINDKKASRKHVVIQKLGNHFVIKDLETVNGTFLNGKKFTEQELSGQDLIKIGETEFQFQAENTEYAQKQEQFLQLPAEIPAESPSEMPMEESVPNAPLDFSAQPQGFQQGFESQDAAAQPGMVGIDPSITEPVEKSLIGRFKKDPKFRKIVIMYGAFLAIAYMVLFDEDKPEPAKAPKPKPSVVANMIGNTYDSLSAEKKKFVDTEYDLGYTSYQQRDYDKAIDSMIKIHALIPEGYKQSKEIERYAREGQAKLRAIEEERKRKEEEEKRKARIRELVDEGRGMMAKKQYEAVKPVMERILELDPENPSVAQWKKEIEAIDSLGIPAGKFSAGLLLGALIFVRARGDRGLEFVRLVAADAGTRTEDGSDGVDAICRHAYGPGAKGGEAVIRDTAGRFLMAGEAWLAGRRYKQSVKTTDFREYLARPRK